nr:RNA recognition motif domain, nucleotide-binding alpha-beta plait domain protein [Tanacetum cinerariifolium]
MLKEKVFILDSDRALMSTEEYMQKVVKDVGDIYNNIKKGKLDKVVVLVKSYSPNALGDLTVTMKDLSGNGYPQRDKNKKKRGQNRARDWKEREKPEPIIFCKVGQT